MNAMHKDKPDAPQGRDDSRFAIRDSRVDGGEPAGNPQTVLDALADPAPLTLGQVALLEKIKSPLLGAGNPAAADVIPGLFLLSIPSAQGAKHLDTLTEDAFKWADTLAPADFSRRWVAAIKALRDFYALLPAPTEDEPKKASPATAG